MLQLAKAFYLLEQGQNDLRMLQYKVDEMEWKTRPLWTILDSMLDATNDLYEERREEMHPHIKELTLDQWESMRFMSSEQFEAFKRRNIR